MDRFNLIKFKSLLFDSAGFTLVEILIAITLLAFVSLATYEIVDSSIITKDRTLDEDQLLVQSLSAINRLDSDFSQIHSPLYFSSKENPAKNTNNFYQDQNQAEGEPSGLFEGRAKNGMLIPQFKSEDKSTLIFFTNSNRRKIADSKESRYQWVKYSIRRSEQESSENELIRQTFASNIYTNEINWNDLKAQVLLTHVKSIEYSFWDQKMKKFDTSLQNLNENKNNIRAIKISLVWLDKDKNEQNIEKNFRILYPYFNHLLDEVKSNNAYGGGPVPPGLPVPPNFED